MIVAAVLLGKDLLGIYIFGNSYEPVVQILSAVIRISFKQQQSNTSLPISQKWSFSQICKLWQYA